MAKEEYIKSHDTVCAELHFNICKRIGGKLDNKQRYERIPKLVETGDEGKFTTVWNRQCEPTELLLTIDWTAQCVTLNKEHECQ